MLHFVSGVASSVLLELHYVLNFVRPVCFHAWMAGRRPGGTMKKDLRRAVLAHPTRRQLVTGIFVAGCGSILSVATWGQSKENKMAVLPGTEANKSRTSLHQEIDYK